MYVIRQQQGKEAWLISPYRNVGASEIRPWGLKLAAMRGG